MSRPFGSLLRASSCGAAVVLATLPATAEPPPRDIPTERIVARLEYNGDPGCSDPEPFVVALSPRVHGWDPLGDGPWRLVITVKRKGGYAAKAELYDPKGVMKLTRSMPAKVKCGEVLDGLALKVSFYIDPPEGLPAPPPPVCAPPPPVPAPPAPVCPAAPPAAPPLVVREPAPSREPDPGPPDAWVPPDPLPKLGLRAGATVLAENYATGQFSVGFALDLGIRYRWLSVALEAHGDPPLGPPPTPGIPLSYARVMGGMLLCLHHDILMLCGVGETGRLLFSATPTPIAARNYDAAGIRAGLELPAGDPRLFVRLMGEILAPIARTAVILEKQTLYETAGTNGGLIIGLTFAP